MTKKQEENPWKIKTSKSVYANPWIEVIDHKVINPAGNDGIYGEVKFRNYAIGIIPLTKDLQTYLVGQYRFPLNLYSWEIPMGGGLKEDDILEAAQRELLEETGIVALNWEHIMTIHPSNSVTDEEGHVFVAHHLEFKNSSPEETEVLQIKKLPFDKVYNMVMEGEITDAISIAGILKCKLLLDQNKIKF